MDEDENVVNDETAIKDSEAEASEENKTAEEAANADDEKPKEEEKAPESKTSDNEAKLLKEAMRRKEENQSLKEKLALYEGIDPAAARDAMKAQEAAKLKELEDRGQYEEIIEQVRTQKDKEIETLREQLNEAKQEISARDMQIVSAKRASAFQDSSFVKTTVLTPAKTERLYGDYFEFEDGEFVGYSQPAGAAKRSPLVDANGKNLSFDAALERIVSQDPEFEAIKRSTVAPGSSSTPPTEKVKSKPEAKTGVDMIAAGLSSTK